MKSGICRYCRTNTVSKPNHAMCNQCFTKDSKTSFNTDIRTLMQTRPNWPTQRTHIQAIRQ